MRFEPRVGAKPDLGDLLSGIRHVPRWLRSRWVWSIAVEAILGQYVASQLRHAARDLPQRKWVGMASISGGQNSL
jgi:hypothetical protein